MTANPTASTHKVRRAGIGVLTTVAIALPISGAWAPSADAASYKFQNCTQLHKKFQHGVGKSNARDKVKGSSKPVTTFKKSTSIYTAVIKYNRNLDRDHDGVACEQR